MANELVVSYPTGNTLYAHVLDSNGQIYNGVAFEAPVNVNYGNYDIAATEAGTTGIYRATMPVVAGGVYGFVFRRQVGGAPATTDPPVASGTIEWDGTDELSLYAINTVAFPAGAVEFTYTVTDSVTGLPIEGVEVWFSTDIAGLNVVWSGNTDVFGIAMDVLGGLPMLDAGTYYVWRQRSGYVFADPDVEVVS